MPSFLCEHILAADTWTSSLLTIRVHRIGEGNKLPSEDIAPVGRYADPRPTFYSWNTKIVFAVEEVYTSGEST